MLQYHTYTSRTSVKHCSARMSFKRMTKLASEELVEWLILVFAVPILIRFCSAIHYAIRYSVRCNSQAGHFCSEVMIVLLNHVTSTNHYFTGMRNEWPVAIIFNKID